MFFLYIIIYIMNMEYAQYSPFPPASRVSAADIDMFRSQLYSDETVYNNIYNTLL